VIAEDDVPRGRGGGSSHRKDQNDRVRERWRLILLDGSV